MSDTTTTAPAPTPTQTAVNTLAQDASDDVVLVKAIVAAVKAAKAGDYTQAAAVAPKALAAVEKDYADVKAALPVLKAGYTTTEFWLIVLGAIAEVVTNAIGHPLPFDVTAAGAALIGIYTFVRGLVKHTSVVAATTVATSATPAPVTTK